jgi:hypothetical protein
LTSRISVVINRPGAGAEELRSKSAASFPEVRQEFAHSSSPDSRLKKTADSAFPGSMNRKAAAQSCAG